MISDECTVLGIDLAYKSWADIGSATLSFTPGAAPIWTACQTDGIAWPASSLTPDTVANAIDHFVRTRGVSAVSIDGPQGWRDPQAIDRNGVGRLCEFEARTPGKTGAFGMVYPRTYTPWVTFSIAVFQALLVRPHVRLVNTPEVHRLDPLPPAHYYLLECFPTSTWRASGLTPLPGHQKAPPIIVESYAQALRQQFALNETAVTAHHDHLQAVVAALPAAALLGGPCAAIPRGEAAYDVPATDETPMHRVEGLIWDAMPHLRSDTTAFERPQAIKAAERVPKTAPAPTAPRPTAIMEPTRACLCGCGGIPKGGRFLPGHDAKLKGILLRRIAQGDSSARDAMYALGWERFIKDVQRPTTSGHCTSQGRTIGRFQSTAKATPSSRVLKISIHS